MIRRPKFMNIEGVYMPQEELDAPIEVGDIIETDLDETKVYQHSGRGSFV
jgi:hypothetical protein